MLKEELFKGGKMNYEKAIIQIKAKSLKAFQSCEFEKSVVLLFKGNRIKERQIKQEGLK